MFAPGQVAPGQAQHQHLGGGHIAGIGDIVLVAQAEDIGHVLVRDFLVGVAEAENHVQLIIGNAGCNLLAAAVVEGQEAVDAQAGGLPDLETGGGGGAKGVLGQNAAVCGAELDHQFLFVVVGDQCDIHGGTSFRVFRFASGAPGAR